MNLILLAQAAATTAATTVSTTTTDVAETTLNATQKTFETAGIWSHIWSSDPLVKLTLLILIGFSVACWAIIFLKVKQLKQAQKNSLAFWQKASTTNRLSEIAQLPRSLAQGPVYELFSAGMQTIQRIRQSTSSQNDRISTYTKSLIEQRLTQTREEEVYKLEQYINFLATTASVAPFIGLFGTVWGILTAFMAIGQAGTSSLATVGPYIAEALVATAVGLFAAIPAVIAYNVFVHKVSIINKQFDLFITDFMLKSPVELAS